MKIFTCPVCGSNKNVFRLVSSDVHGHKLMSKDKGFVYAACGVCEALFLTGVDVNPKFFKKYYNNEYYKNTTGGLRGLFESLLVRLSLHNNINIIEKLIKDKGRVSILDIGAGDLGFLSSLDEKKFERSAIDLNPTKVHKNINIIRGDFLEYGFGKQKFDVITLWHSLEHLKTPKVLFNKIKKLLDINGIVVLSTPNTDGLGYKIGKENWFHLDSPRHLVLYNTRTIKKLSKRCGFILQDKKKDVFSFPMDLYWSVRKSALKYLIIPLYPLWKLIDNETTIFILKKK